MDVLPTEIILTILPFLKVTELGIFVQTCKRYYDIGNPLFQQRKSKVNVNVITAFAPAPNKKGNLFCLRRANNLPEDEVVSWDDQTTKVT